MKTIPKVEMTMESGETVPVVVSHSGNNTRSEVEVSVTGNNDGAHMFVFTNEKAGMKSVDKEHANRIIYEMSKNSSYYKQAEIQDKKVDAKVSICSECELVRIMRYNSASEVYPSKLITAARYVHRVYIAIMRR